MTQKNGKTSEHIPDWTLAHHELVQDRPHVKHPWWADELGIPSNTNRGIATITVPVHIAKAVLLQANHENRPLNDKRIRPIRLALENNSYREDSPDGWVIDWNWETMNAQKRLSGSVEAGIPITIRVEYGVDPALRPYIDANEWRKYHDRWTWTENAEDNKIVNQMMALHFKIYSGLGTGSYSHDDALRMWEKYGHSFRWVAQLVRRNRLLIQQKAISSQTVSSYYALAQLHYRDREKAQKFANEVYAIPQAEGEEKGEQCQQAVAYRRWLTRPSPKTKTVDQKVLYGYAVYFMKRAFTNEPVKYGKDKRIKTKRGEFEPGMAVPLPTETRWEDTSEEHRTAVSTVGKEQVGKELRREKGLTCVESIIGAAALLNREGIGSQHLKEVVLQNIPRWSLASRIGNRFYRAVQKETNNAEFSTAVCVAFVYNHVDCEKLDEAEAFGDRLVKRDFVRLAAKQLATIRTIYGFKSRVGKELAFSQLEELIKI